jgi:hypothetical protein
MQQPSISEFPYVGQYLVSNDITTYHSHLQLSAQCIQYHYLSVAPGASRSHTRVEESERHGSLALPDGHTTDPVRGDTTNKQQTVPC